MGRAILCCSPSNYSRPRKAGRFWNFVMTMRWHVCVYRQKFPDNRTNRLSKWTVHLNYTLPYDGWLVGDCDITKPYFQLLRTSPTMAFVIWKIFEIPAGGNADTLLDVQSPVWCGDSVDALRHLCTSAADATATSRPRCVYPGTPAVNTCLDRLVLNSIRPGSHRHYTLWRYRHRVRKKAASHGFSVGQSGMWPLHGRWTSSRTQRGCWKAVKQQVWVGGADMGNRMQTWSEFHPRCRDVVHHGGETRLIRFPRDFWRYSVHHKRHRTARDTTRDTRIAAVVKVRRRTSGRPGWRQPLPLRQTSLFARTIIDTSRKSTSAMLPQGLARCWAKHGGSAQYYYHVFTSFCFGKSRSSAKWWSRHLIRCLGVLDLLTNRRFSCPAGSSWC